MLSSMCNRFYWQVHGDLFRLGYSDNKTPIELKPNWALLKVKNHAVPVYISQHNKNFKRLAGYSIEILEKGRKVKV